MDFQDDLFSNSFLLAFFICLVVTIVIKACKYLISFFIHKRRFKKRFMYLMEELEELKNDEYIYFN